VGIEMPNIVSVQHSVVETLGEHGRNRSAGLAASKHEP